MEKENHVKEFFSKNKGVIFGVCACLLIFVLLGVVVARSGNFVNNDEVMTSAGRGDFIMPIKNGTIIKDYSNSMLKYNATLNHWESHKAVDIKGEDDADVLCVMDGKVVGIEDIYLLGKVVTIEHSNSLRTVYASLDEEVNVELNQKIKAGEKIGKVSTSAKGETAEGPHLHFEVHQNGKKVDPNLYLENSNK